MATCPCSGVLGSCKYIIGYIGYLDLERINFKTFQLEVLELLVQNGADLNARNKHDETPAGKDSFKYK